MENELKNIWKQAEQTVPIALPEEILAKAKQETKNERITLWVLGTTITVLTAYLIYASTFVWTTFQWALLLMIASLCVRVSAEFYQIQSKSRQATKLNLKAYCIFLRSYYRNRMWTHGLLTTITFGLYLYGFSMLLPTFKGFMSEGFYLFSTAGAVISFVVVAVLIVKQIIEEYRRLKAL